MRINFLHLSDIHFYPGSFEKKPAFAPFLSDLEEQLSAHDCPTYLVLSGDVAKAASDVGHYDALLEILSPALELVGIPRSRRICVPGNHDVSTTVIYNALEDHEAIASRGFDEGQFNDYVEKPASVFTEKFNNYLSFQLNFADFGVSKENIQGCGHVLPEGLGIYCANTAFLSSGGIIYRGNKIVDKGRLALPTRSISNWLAKTPSNRRVFIGHHPSDWLNAWSRGEFRQLCSSFDLAFSGHLHVQDIFHSVEYGRNLVELHAPALLTDKTAPMGYAIADYCTERGPISVKYRQWSHKSKFVLGALMADNDLGVVQFNASNSTEVRSGPSDKNNTSDIAFRYYQDGLDRSLCAFGKRQVVWVEPIINRVSETDPARAAKSDPINIDKILTAKGNVCIKAPPQYGLTCLGWMLCKESAKADVQNVWLRVDLSVTKPHKVRDELNRLCVTFGKSRDEVACVLVDSWSTSMHNGHKCLDAISKEFPKARLVLFQTLDSLALDSSSSSTSSWKFEELYLWALSRSGLRKVVHQYQESYEAGGELERTLVKIVSHLEALNLPRTPLNCLTLLMVSEADQDDAPINRAEVIKRILTLIFNSDISLTYKSRADIHDCENLIGFFAEEIVSGKTDHFSRASFISSGVKFCKKMLVDIDVKGVLQLLIESGVIVDEGDFLRFRFSYWIYYFAALRMYHSDDFRKYIFSNMQYTRFPEVIEFYTGIDRRRQDALEQLDLDLTDLCNSVEAKCGFSSPADLFAAGRWDPTEAEVARMRAEIEERVAESSLPLNIKDEFADRSYDAAKPYDQQIKSLINVYSLANLTAGVQAGARALRNSDFVDPELKKRLLGSIMRCWEQVQTVLVLLAPILAKTGHAAFDGTHFLLDEKLRDAEPTAKSIGKIWSVVPYNILMWFRSDITSAKMGPLLFAMLKEQDVALTRHNLAIIIAAIRPKGWKEVIADYIEGVNRSSFFLHDIFTFLQTEHRYVTLPDKTREDVEGIIKMSVAKHEKGSKRPSATLINSYKLKPSQPEIGGGKGD